MKAPTFAAIDFETASRDPGSAISVGVVRVEDGMVVGEHEALIRPPEGTEFEFTSLHGIGPEEVTRARSFAEVWRSLQPLVERVWFLAAHNAAFERRVLRTCWRRSGREERTRFLCTMELAREVWGIYPTRLPDVCRELGIPLRHHRSSSDAGACAEVVLRAWLTTRGMNMIQKASRR